MRNPLLAASALVAALLPAAVHAQGCAAPRCTSVSAYADTSVSAAAYLVQPSDCVGSPQFKHFSVTSTVTVPSGLPAGCRILFKQEGGPITFAGSGITIESLGGALQTAGLNAVAQIEIESSGNASLSGNIQ